MTIGLARGFEMAEDRRILWRRGQAGHTGIRKTKTNNTSRKSEKTNKHSEKSSR